MITLTRPEIEGLIDLQASAPLIEAAFIAVSSGQVNLPPVGHITFPNHAADCHIKYGHILGTNRFVIKVATGFPGNQRVNLPTGNGLSLVMSAVNGQVEAILHDEMLLTDLRTGIAGAIASKLLARKDAKQVLILGTGPQAVHQIQAHQAILNRPLNFHLWGRDPQKAIDLAARLTSPVSVVTNLKHAVTEADIIVSATGATNPLFPANWVTPGTHITAVGADAPGKQEWDISLIGRATIRVADMISQCLDHGEFSHAFEAGLITKADLQELGSLLAQKASFKRDPNEISIADLTGLAAQDIAIANSILDAHAKPGH